MSHWFDAQAAKSRGLTPAQRRKIKQIEAALGKSDTNVVSYVDLIGGYERSLLRFGPDPKYDNGVSPVELRTYLSLRDELLSARDRLDALHTGLRAERELSSALTEAAAAVTQWRRGMATSDPLTIDRAKAAATRHFAAGDRLGKAGLANLKRGH
jgi:hypothetical protein